MLYIQSLIKLIICYIIYSILSQVSSTRKIGYSIIWGQIRRVYNKRSKDAKIVRENSRECFALLNSAQDLLKSNRTLNLGTVLATK